MTAHDEPPCGEWITLRDKHGKVQARYCPSQQLLLIRERGQTTAHDLGKFSALVDRSSTGVLEFGRKDW